jgi:hypothetical protein
MPYKMEEILLKIKNITCLHVFLKKLSYRDKILQTSAKFLGIVLNSATRNSAYFRGIFANSVPHTEGTEVKKGTEFRVDRIP